MIKKMKNKSSSGSVLIFTLIMMFMLLTLAIGMMSVTAIERKSGGAGGKSVVAFQVADSGAEKVMNILRKKSPNDLIQTWFTCDSNNNVTGTTSGGNYTITFLTEGGATVACIEPIANVYQIKSVGMYAGTNRAVQVAVAADYWTLGTNPANIQSTNSGNVGIGTPNPTAKLDVYGDIAIDGLNNWWLHTPDDGRTSLYFGRGSNGAITEFPIEFRAGGSVTFGGDVYTGGAAGAGGSFYDPALPYTDGVSYLCFRPSGGQFGLCNSLRAMKENIKGLDLGLDLLMKLNPVSFSWKESNQSDLGFIAEEVNEVSPLLSTYDQKGQLTGVKYSQMSALLTKSIQEQQDEINNLKSQIDGLKLIVCLDHPDSDYCRK
jgi:hypothetical protein